MKETGERLTEPEKGALASWGPGLPVGGSESVFIHVCLSVWFSPVLFDTMV